jgi:hypothetical protein
MGASLTERRFYFRSIVRESIVDGGEKCLYSFVILGVSLKRESKRT